MGKGKYENIASADDYSFADPTGQFQGALDNYNNMASFGKEGMVNALNPDNAYNAFMGQAGGLANLAQGPGSQLTQQLNSIAGRQAREGISNAGTQFAGQGAFHSGASARAMGEAAANPFADVAAMQQARQADLTGQLWGQSFGGQQQLQNTSANLYGGIYGQGMQGAGGMASQMGGLVAPQYEYQKGGMDHFMGALNTGLGAATAFAGAGVNPLGWLGGGGGGSPGGGGMPTGGSPHAPWNMSSGGGQSPMGFNPFYTSLNRG